MTNWISVEDRLPENGQEVFIHPPADFGFDQHAAVYDNGFQSEDYCRDEGVLFVDVTHHVNFWMPLPAPPEGL